jgi:hypothetical protein
MRRRSTAALVGLALCATAAWPAAAADPRRGPMAFQSEGADSCLGGHYCLYVSPGFNVGAKVAKQVWAYDEEWKDFRSDPVTAAPYVPDPTDRVLSVVNAMTHDVHLMEWEFGAPGSVCLTVAARSSVAVVTQQHGSDGGYGSVSFDGALAAQHKCKRVGTPLYPG